MRKVALLFLFAIVGSLTLVLDSAFAQMEHEETMDETMTDEETMDETMTDEETMDETMTDEETMDETMMETTSEEDVVISPLQQLALGVDPHGIECRDGQRLVFKASNWQPACINESSYSTLSARGWIAPHDPTHADLEKMVEKYMEKRPQADDGQVEIEEEIIVDGQTGVNGTDVEEPKSHVIELREDMEMGAN